MLSCSNIDEVNDVHEGHEYYQPFKGPFRRYEFPKDYDDHELFLYFKNWLLKIYEGPSKTKFVSLRVAIRYGYKPSSELIVLLRQLIKLPDFQFYYVIPVMSEPVHVFDEPLFEYFDIFILFRSKKLVLNCEELYSRIDTIMNKPDPAGNTAPPFGDYEFDCNDENPDAPAVRFCLFPSRYLISLNVHIVGFSKTCPKVKIRNPTLKFLNFLELHFKKFGIELHFKVIDHD